MRRYGDLSFGRAILHGQMQVRRTGDDRGGSCGRKRIRVGELDVIHQNMPPAAGVAIGNAQPGGLALPVANIPFAQVQLLLFRPAPRGGAHDSVIDDQLDACLALVCASTNEE